MEDADSFSDNIDETLDIDGDGEGDEFPSIEQEAENEDSLFTSPAEDVENEAISSAIDSNTVSTDSLTDIFSADSDAHMDTAIKSDFDEVSNEPYDSDTDSEVPLQDDVPIGDTQTKDDFLADEAQTQDDFLADDTQTQDDFSVDDTQTQNDFLADDTQTQDDFSADEVQTQDDFSADEAQTQDDFSADDTQTQDDFSADEVQTQDDFSVDEVQTQDDFLADEVQTQDDFSADEVQTQDDFLADEVQTQDDFLADEVSSEISFNGSTEDIDEDSVSNNSFTDYDSETKADSDNYEQPAENNGAEDYSEERYDFSSNNSSSLLDNLSDFTIKSYDEKPKEIQAFEEESEHTPKKFEPFKFFKRNSEKHDFDELANELADLEKDYETAIEEAKNLTGEANDASTDDEPAYKSHKYDFLADELDDL